MIKFIHKKHVREEGEKGKIIIYYNVTDIFLGIILVALVVFFIHDYLSHSLRVEQNDCRVYQNPSLNLNTINIEKKVDKK